MPSGVHQAYRWPRLLRSVVLFLGRVPNSQSRFACACTCLELSSVPSGEAALFVGHVHTYTASHAACSVTAIPSLVHTCRVQS
jgi:hypothetical protein